MGDFSAEDGADLGGFEICDRVFGVDHHGHAVAADGLGDKSDSGLFCGLQLGAVGRARGGGDIGSPGDEGQETRAGAGALQRDANPRILAFKCSDEEWSELFTEGIGAFDAEWSLGHGVGQSQRSGKEEGDKFHDVWAAASRFCFRFRSSMANPPMRAKPIMTGYHPDHP